MVTGASTANLAIILIDARKGVIEQTFRHSIIASLLNIKHIVVAVNKMDLVNFDKETYEKIKSEYLKFSLQLNLKDIYFIPMSALLGDNVVDASQNMDWYKGKTLLSTLESVNVAHDLNEQDFRFPVQYVIRPHSTEFHDYRGYAGKIEGGKVKVGDTLQAMNSGLNSKIKSINFGKNEILEAQAGKCVSITLEDEIDISRGDMLVKTNSLPQSSQEIDIMLCWLNEKKIQTNAKYILRHTGKEVKCMVKNIEYKLNISTLEKEIDATIGVNDIGKVKVKTASPLFFDLYLSNRVTGSVILVDEFTNETVGAGMIV